MAVSNEPLIARTTLTLVSDTQTRLPSEWWEQLGEPDQFTISTLEQQTRLSAGSDSGDETVSVYDRGQFRLPVDVWRDMNQPSQLTADLVETDGDRLEVRLTV